MRARIIRAYIAKPKNIPLISLISQYTRPRDKRDKRVIFPLDSYIYARTRAYYTRVMGLTSMQKKENQGRTLDSLNNCICCYGLLVEPGLGICKAPF
jgi:hypothetical protein